MKATLLSAAIGATVLAGAIASTSNAAAPITGHNPLRVGLYAAGGGMVEVILTNTSAKSVRVPRWALPEQLPAQKIFNVQRDSQPVAYEGRMIKRGVPTAAEFAVLRPGQSRRTLVDLGSAYDMRKSGQYTVTLVSAMQYASLSGGTRLKTPRGMPLLLQSAPISFWSNGSGAAPLGKGKPGSGGGTVVNGVTTVGCSATQVTGIGNAITQARAYTENAKGYLAGNNQGSRYTTWFGAYTSQRYGTARQHFVDIDAAMDQNAGQVKVNCGCNQSYYAYVYPTRPYEIFVCRAFWSAPNAGTDSRAGTLVHEMSHFNAVAGTDDHVYGQSAAKSLALSDPDAALDNADSHEYFGENTPFQN